MNWFYKLLRSGFIVFFVLSIIGLIATLGIFLWLAPGLPTVATLKEVHLQVPLRVYSREGDLLAEYGEKRRKPMHLDEIPNLMQKAFLAAEDDRFFEHPGVDYQGLLRATLHLVRTGEKGQGGSTITMQLARNFFLTRERTYTRKLREIFLALKVERELTKQEILELYLNKIYLGNRAYGVGAAAEVYYGVAPDSLTLAQIAMIAGLPKAPSAFIPSEPMSGATMSWAGCTHWVL
jgi:penicillin-binding protein 1A